MAWWRVMFYAAAMWFRTFILLATCAATASCWAVPFGLMAAGVNAAKTRAVEPRGTPARMHAGVTGGLMQRRDDWRPAESMPWAAVDADFRIEDGPLWFSSYLGVGYTEDVPASVPGSPESTMAIDNGLGLRHYRAFGILEPFVGLGFATVDHRVRGADGAPGQSTDLGFGGYAELGLGVAATESMSVGLLVRRYHGEDATLHERELPGEYTTFGLFVMWRL